MRNGPGDSSSTGAVAMTSRELVSAFLSLTPTLALLFRVALARVVVAVLVVAVVAIVVVIAVRLLPLLVLLFLLLLQLLLAPLLRLLPLLVVIVGVAGAQDCEAAVRVTTGSLDNQVAVRVAGAALVD